MKYQPHLVGSIIMSASFPFLAKEAGINLSFNDLALIMPAIVLGGNFCDIDTESIPSRIYAAIGTLLTLFWVYSNNYEFIWLIWIPFIAAKMFGHRKWAHSWKLPIVIVFLPLIIDLIMFYFNFNIRFIQDLIIKYRQSVNGFAFGICTHLFIDIKKIKKIVRFIGGEKLVKLLYG